MHRRAVAAAPEVKQTSVWQALERSRVQAVPSHAVGINGRWRSF